MRRKTVMAMAAVATLAVLGAGLGLSSPVRASEDECRVPMAEWRPREELQAKLQAEGWQRIDRVKVDDGCYEAEGYDREGFRVEAKYDPKTFELVKLERKRDRIRDQDRVRERERVRDPALGPSGAGTQAGSGAGAAAGGGADGSRGN